MPVGGRVRDRVVCDRHGFDGRSLFIERRNRGVNCILEVGALLANRSVVSIASSRRRSEWQADNNSTEEVIQARDTIVENPRKHEDSAQRPRPTTVVT